MIYCPQFALSLDKIGCTSTKYSSKLDILCSVCTIFAEDKDLFIAMNIEEIREYCLSLPLVTEDFPFDETTLVFRTMGKIFAMIDLENTEWFVLKCEPEFALELREHYSDISGAWHMNKKYWNQLNLFGSLPDSLVQGLIRHSYSEVVKKMPRKIKTENEILTTVQM